MRPASQMWPMETFYLARTDQSFVRSPCLFDINAPFEKNETLFWTLNMSKRTFWPVMIFESRNYALHYMNHF